jgi:hypothetical protein
MRSREELVREAESRNQARIEARLPLLSVEAEVRKAHKAERDAAYRNWFKTHPFLQQFFAEALAKERERRNVTDWCPTLLNGSADIDRYVDKKMRPPWEEERHKVVTW